MSSAHVCASVQKTPLLQGQGGQHYPALNLKAVSVLPNAQQAREMVLEIIRDKDQADFRGVRNDFTSRMGGSSVEVGGAPCGVVSCTS